MRSAYIGAMSYQACFARPFLSITALSCALFVWACSSTTTTTAAGADPSVEPDGSAPSDDLDAGPEPTTDASDAQAVDAALPPEKVTVTTGTAGSSCDSVCAKSGFTCTATCTFGNTSGMAAGQVSYQKSSGGFTSYDYAALKTCTDVASPTSPNYGSSYTLATSLGTAPIACCCLGPGHERLAGDVKAPKTCNDVCKAAGRTCDPASSWSFGDKGGWEAQYACTGSTAIEHGACDVVPPPTHKQCTLKSFTCSCK